MGTNFNIAEVFDIAAKDYDETRRKYISCFDDFYGIAIEQIPYGTNDQFKILDLGAGTGLLSSLVKEAFPYCKITLSDISSEMLEKAKKRLGHSDSVSYIQNDYINDEISGEYDVVISALSLHHSTQSELKSVFSKINNSLRNGGIFINADQILGRTPKIEISYEKAWLEQAKSNGCTENEITVALERMTADKTLPLSTQINMLEQEGFKNTNCWYQYYRYAVYSGVKCT